MEVQLTTAIQSKPAFFTGWQSLPADIYGLIFRRLYDIELISAGLVSKKWNERVTALQTKGVDENTKESIRALGIFLFKPKAITAEVKQKVCGCTLYMNSIVERDLWLRIQEYTSLSKDYELFYVLTPKFFMESQVLDYLRKNNLQEVIYNTALHLTSYEKMNNYAESLTDPTKKLEIKKRIFEKSIHRSDAGIAWYEHVINLDPTYTPANIATLQTLLQQLHQRARRDHSSLLLLQGVFRLERERIASVKHFHGENSLYDQVSFIFNYFHWDLTHFLATGIFKIARSP